MRKEDQDNLYRVLTDYIPKNVLSNKNRNRSWLYGYNDQYDVIVISKTGQIGDIISISGINIAIPPTPDKCYQRSSVKSEQYWERQPLS